MSKLVRMLKRASVKIAKYTARPAPPTKANNIKDGGMTLPTIYRVTIESILGPPEHRACFRHGCGYEKCRAFRRYLGGRRAEANRSTNILKPMPETR